MIEVANVTKRYVDTTAVDDISFTVAQGDVLGFLGPNGAGKTTTMKMLCGFFPPSEGKIRVAGHDILEHPMEVKKMIGYLPETPPLYPEMLVADYIAFVADIKGVEKKQKKSKVDHVVERCGLQKVAKRPIANLSKGFKQRVGLAQAMVHDPKIMVLDEPTVGLDPAQIIEIRNLIKDLGRDHTIILSTHILPEVTMTCNRVIIINRGTILASDTYENLSKTGSQKLLVQVRKNGGGIKADLEKINGVKKVDETDGSTFTIETSGSPDVNEQIAKYVVNGNLGLLKLQPHMPTMEEIYLKLISGQQ